MAPDGSIIIDTRLDSQGFSQGMKKLQVSAAGALNEILLPVLKIGEKVRGVFDGLVNIVSKIGAVLKKLLFGAFIVFALSLQKIFSSLRESITEILNLPGNEAIKKDVEGIQNSFVELRNAVAVAFLPLLTAAIPYIQKVIDWLMKTINYISMVIAAFMGQKQVMQVVAGSAQKIADANKKTEKAVKGQLAAFDQINVLQKQQPEATTDLPKVAAEMLPITDDILSKVQALKDLWAQLWIDPLPILKNLWNIFKEWFKTNIIDPITKWWEDSWLKKNIADPIAQWFSDLWEKIKVGAAGVWNVIVLGAEGAWILIQAAWGQLQPFFQNMWDTIVAITQDRWKAIGEMIEAAKQVFRGIIEFIHGIFTRDWSEAWRGITDIFQGTFNGWKAFLKGTINTMIDFINGLLRAIVMGVNAMSAALNSIQFDIPDWIPVIGGNTFSLNIPTVTAPQIPKLATGAVIPPNAAFAAVLGDQRSGKNIEAPESLIRQIIREEIGSIDASVSVSFEGTFAQFVREMKPHFDRETVRIGGSLIKSGMTR